MILVREPVFGRSRLRLPRRLILAGAASLITRPALAAATTWNPANKAANITLSGANLIATGIATGGAAASVFATTSHAAGKWYFEITANSRDGSAAFFMGIANASQTVTGATGGAFSIVSQMTAGNVGVTFFNSINIGQDGISATGTIAQVAVDLSAKLYWTKQTIAGQGWNSNGGANPATGAGGYSFAAMSGPWFPFFQSFGAAPADSATLNVGTIAFTGTPPAGFIGWDGSQVSGSVAGMLMGGG